MHQLATPSLATPSRGSYSKTSKRATKTAVIAAAPLLLAEADLQASIVFYDTALSFDLNGGHAVWSWTFPDALGWGNAPAVFATIVPIELSIYDSRNGDIELIQFATFGSVFRQFSEAERIDDGVTFSTTGVLLANETPAYYGFFIQSKVDSSYHYGWLEMSTSAAGDMLWIHRWAIEDQGDTSIAAGAVPEAADFALGLGALAAGAATVLRKRRKEAA